MRVIDNPQFSVAQILEKLPPVDKAGKKTEKLAFESRVSFLHDNLIHIIEEYDKNKKLPNLGRQETDIVTPGGTTIPFHLYRPVTCPQHHVTCLGDPRIYLGYPDQRDLFQIGQDRAYYCSTVELAPGVEGNRILWLAEMLTSHIEMALQKKRESTK